MSQAFQPGDAAARETLPAFQSSMVVGFPSPAADYWETSLDLNRYLIKRPAATFFVRSSGNAMIPGGVHPGDLLIVDRSLPPLNNRVVIAVLNGELTVRRVRLIRDRLFLSLDDPAFSPVEINEWMDFQPWGVATHAIHPL